MYKLVEVELLDNISETEKKINELEKSGYKCIFQVTGSEQAHRYAAQYILMCKDDK